MLCCKFPDISELHGRVTQTAMLALWELPYLILLCAPCLIKWRLSHPLPIFYPFLYLPGAGRLCPQLSKPESLHGHFSQLKVRKGDFIAIIFFRSRSDLEVRILFYPPPMWHGFNSGFNAKFGLSLSALYSTPERGFSPPVLCGCHYTLLLRVRNTES